MRSAFIREFTFDHALTFSPAEAEMSLAQLPAEAGIFALFGHGDGDQPYISRTPNLRRRITRLLAPDSAATRRLNLNSRIARIEYSRTASEFSASIALFRAHVALLGLDAAEKRLRLHTPYMVRLTVENAYPRAYVTNRISSRAFGSTFGPFPARAAAERFLEESLNLFKLRRCHEELHPDPAFPGCVYSEMKMCLAPCFKGCTDERYAVESAAVGKYLATRGESLVQILSASRDAASEGLDFERAAEMHTAIARVQAAAHLADEIVHPLDQLNGVVLQKSLEGAEIFLLRCGLLYGPAQIAADFSAEALEAAMALLEAEHDAVAKKKLSPREVGCSLALLKRWYYRSEKHRAGEILFANSDGTLPLKRIARAVNRILKPAPAVVHEEAPQEAAAPPADTLAIE